MSSVSDAYKFDGDLAPAHIMVSSPAFPGISDVVRVYVQNIIAIDHQSFGILIRERLIIVLGGIRGSCLVLRGLRRWGQVKRWCRWSIVRKCKRSRSSFELLYPSISPRLPWMLRMLCCISAIPSIHEKINTLLPLFRAACKSRCHLYHPPFEDCH